MTQPGRAATPSWRPMLPSDVAPMVALAAIVHPAFPEDADTLAERLALYPAGCFALDGADGLDGYLLSHPWRLGHPPGLNQRLGALPNAPDTLYLHDLALHPARRGGGAAGAILHPYLATGGWPSHSLVAVNGSTPFWRHFGFRPSPSAAPGSYGGDAVHMVRPEG